MNSQVAEGKGQLGKGLVPRVEPVGPAVWLFPAWLRCRRRALNKRPLLDQGRVTGSVDAWNLCAEETVVGGCVESVY